MILEGTPVRLCRGLLDASGARHREVVVGPVTGHTELALARGGTMPSAWAVAHLLAGVLVRVGRFQPVEPEIAILLPRDDQAHLALVLRQQLLGDRLSLVLTCPACREQADVDLNVPTLLPGDTPLDLSFTVQTDAGPITVREPTGADDAAVEGLDDAAATSLLWSRLVIDVDGEGPLDPQGWQALGPRVHQQVALGLSEHQGGPDLSFFSTCPECGAVVGFTLDAPALLAAEAGGVEARLLAEIHVLAFHYHWAEGAILDLPRNRRWTYLDLVGRQLAGRPLLGASR